VKRFQPVGPRNEGTTPGFRGAAFGLSAEDREAPFETDFAQGVPAAGFDVGALRAAVNNLSASVGTALMGALLVGVGQTA
jgi:hypothetical protein